MVFKSLALSRFSDKTCKGWTKVIAHGIVWSKMSEPNIELLRHALNPFSALASGLWVSN